MMGYCQKFSTLSKDEYFWRRVVDKNFPEFFPPEFQKVGGPDFYHHSQMWKKNCQYLLFKKNHVKDKFSVVMEERGQYDSRDDFVGRWLEGRQLLISAFGGSLAQNQIECDLRPLLPLERLFKNEGLELVYPEFKDTGTSRYLFFNFNCQKDISWYQISHLLNQAWHRAQSQNPQIYLHDPQIFLDEDYFA